MHQNSQFDKINQSASIWAGIWLWIKQKKKTQTHQSGVREFSCDNSDIYTMYCTVPKINHVEVIQEHYLFKVYTALQSPVVIWRRAAKSEEQEYWCCLCCMLWCKWVASSSAHPCNKSAALWLWIILNLISYRHISSPSFVSFVVRAGNASYWV